MELENATGEAQLAVCYAVLSLSSASGLCVLPLLFPLHVYLYRVPLAFIFLLRIQLGKTSSSFRAGEGGVGCEGNEFLQTLRKALS